MFWDDFNNPSKTWVREIIFYGTDKQCIEYEHKILRGPCLNHRMHYNNVSSKGIVFTDEVRKKISDAAKGRVLTPEIKAKISSSMMGNTNRKGHKNSPEHRKKLSESAKKYWQNKRKSKAA